MKEELDRRDCFSDRIHRGRGRAGTGGGEKGTTKKMGEEHKLRVARNAACQ